MKPGTEQAFDAAARIFAGELARSRCTRQDRDGGQTTCVLAPSGICVHRLFLVGALTEVHGVPGDAMHARIADPTGTFELEIGWQDRKCGDTLAALPIPSFAAVTGSCRLPPGSTDRPPVVMVEAIDAVDRGVRDAWVKRTALATIERLELLAPRLRGEPGDPLLAETVREYRLDRAALISLADMVLSALASVREEGASVAAGPAARETVLAILAERKAPISYADLLAAGAERGCTEETVKQAIVALLEEGECYQPRAGLIKLA